MGRDLIMSGVNISVDRVLRTACNYFVLGVEKYSERLLEEALDLLTVSYVVNEKIAQEPPFPPKALAKAEQPFPQKPDAKVAATFRGFFPRYIDCNCKYLRTF